MYLIAVYELFMINVKRTWAFLQIKRPYTCRGDAKGWNVYICRSSTTFYQLPPPFPFIRPCSLTFPLFISPVLLPRWVHHHDHPAAVVTHPELWSCSPLTSLSLKRVFSLLSAPSQPPFSFLFIGSADWCWGHSDNICFLSLAWTPWTFS